MADRPYEPLTDAMVERIREGAKLYSAWASYAGSPECMHCSMPGWVVIVVAKPSGELGCITLCSDHAMVVKEALKDAVGPARRIGNVAFDGRPRGAQSEVQS